GLKPHKSIPAFRIPYGFNGIRRVEGMQKTHFLEAGVRFANYRQVISRANPFYPKGIRNVPEWHAASESGGSVPCPEKGSNSQPAVNSTATPFDRHKRITLLFLKHAPLRNAPPDERAA